MLEALGGTSEEARTYADAIVDQIKSQDKADLKGWIVDIRDNGGENMFPMLGAIGSILGEGILGYFQTPDGNRVEWIYLDGEVKVDGITNFRLPDPYTLLKEGSPKVAVLTNGASGSSGEAVVIAFRGRPNTKSFGTATCGRPTSNVGYPLSNNSTLFLTVGFMVDRNGNVYEESILPDEIITDNDLMLEVAKEWLRML
ncbi:S41 family peptidase [Ulvibacterium sp.]|uniref:S41 family peptidase n=1 Tax=Ulvibacterium sp. TaxID=2665914 RepID=UPI002606D8D8|nr:S41 family peptidase [Ulvibacterium sp.]